MNGLRRLVGMEVLRWQQDPSTKALEYTGAIFGILGAALLAETNSVSRWGWTAFLASNFMLIGLGTRQRLWGFVGMQLIFTVTSLRGIQQNFF